MFRKKRKMISDMNRGNTQWLDAMNVYARITFPSKDNARADPVLVRTATLLVTSLQFFSMWKRELSNLTRRSVQRPTTLLDGIDLSLRMLTSKSTDLLTLAPD